MRLVHVIQRGVLDVSTCQAVVLDEADRLFEEGFLEQIDTILGTPTSCLLSYFLLFRSFLFFFVLLLLLLLVVACCCQFNPPWSTDRPFLILLSLAIGQFAT
jgi:hypothetical protein